MIFPVKRLADLGFEILATAGTATCCAATASQRRRAQALRGSRAGRRADDRRPDHGRRGRHGGQHPVRPGGPGTTATRSAPRRRRWTARASPPSSSSPRRSRRSRRPGTSRSGCLAAGARRSATGRATPRPGRARGAGALTGPATATGIGRPSFGARLAARDGRPRPAVRRHRPAPGAAGRLGAARRRRAGWSGSRCTVRRGARRTVVAVVKPQSAFFERHGAAGIAVLERVLAGACRRRRAERSSTSSAATSARPWPPTPTRPSRRRVARWPPTRSRSRPTSASASLRPLLDLAAAPARGVFVLALTSNPEGRAVQHAPAAPDGRTVAQAVVDAAAAENAGRGRRSGRWASSSGYATAGRPDLGGLDLQPLAGPLLAPGLGAQGARRGRPAAGVRSRAPATCCPARSREVLAPGPTVGAARGRRRTWTRCSRRRSTPLPVGNADGGSVDRGDPVPTPDWHRGARDGLFGTGDPRVRQHGSRGRSLASRLGREVAVPDSAPSGPGPDQGRCGAGRGHPRCRRDGESLGSSPAPDSRAASRTGSQIQPRPR